MHSVVNRRSALVSLIALSLSLAAVFIAAPASAATIGPITTTDDGTDAAPGDGACATEDDDCTLRAAIQEANATPGFDTIVVPAGTYRLSCDLGQLDVTRNLNLVGVPDLNGTRPVVDAQYCNRVFSIDTEGSFLLEVFMANLVIRHGDTYDANCCGSGAGIYNYRADLTLANVDVVENASYYAGGGIYNDRGSLTLTDVRVNSNFVYDDDGGGIYNAGDISWDGGELRNNTSYSYSGGGLATYRGAVALEGVDVSNNTSYSYGGGIYDDEQSVLDLVDTTVTGNIAYDYGGGIYLEQSTLRMTGGSVSKNYSYGYGGGIYNDYNSVISLTGTSVTHNKAEDSDGGGIYHYYGSLTLNGANVSFNRGDSGGGIYNYYGLLSISDSTINSNSEEDGTGGGGIYNYYSDAGSSIVNSTVNDNAADDYGGGIYNEESDLLLSGTEVNGNFGYSEGGGIYHYYGTLRVTDGSSVDNNITGGSDGAGIYVDEGDARVVDSTVNANGNPDGGDGGGIYLDDGKLKLDGARVNDNFAEDGAGIYADGEVLTIVDSTVNRNVTEPDGDGYGGGIYLNDGVATIRGSEVSGNVASYYGGGIYHYSGYLLRVIDSEVSENLASAYNGYGGGIYTQSGPLTLVDSTVADNNAYYDGGGIYQDSGDALRVVRSTISGNHATDGYGGGIYQYSGPLTLTNSTVSGNIATWDGGGIYNDDSGLQLNHVTVTDNHVADGTGGGGLYTGYEADIESSVVAGNNSDNCSLGASVNSAGYNVEAPADLESTTCDFDEDTDVLVEDALLAPLALNAPGATATHSLFPGSPVIDAGKAFSEPPDPEVDQRGVERPFDGDGEDGAAADPGAFEVEDEVPLDGDVAAFEVNIEDDDSDDLTGDGVCDTGDEPPEGEDTACTLRAAIEESNDSPGGNVIVLPFFSEDTYDISGELSISRNLAIVGVPDEEGNRPAIDANDDSRVFYIEGNDSRPIDVFMSDLVIQNGDVGGAIGGGIYNSYGNLTLERVDVLSNEAAFGAGIWNDYGSLTLSDAAVNDNTALAVFCCGTTGYGGAIYNSYGDVNWSGGEAIGNYAYYDGGAVYNEYGNVVIDPVTIDGNEADNGDGGGVYNHYGTLDLTDVDVTNNTAYYYGGGIYNYYSTFSMAGGSVSGNMADIADDGYEGGGLYNWYAPSTLTDVDVTGNHAYEGGGIYHYEDTLTITGGSVSGNGLEVDGEGAFTGNVTDYGGGIYIEEGTLDISGSAVDGNVAYYDGGGIYNWYGQAGGSIADSSVDGNMSDVGGGGYSGGGIYNYSAQLTLENTTVDDNGFGDPDGSGEVFGDVTTGYGGGVYNDSGSVLELTDGTSVSGNSASYDGGGIWTVDSVLTATDAFVNGNVAGTGGIEASYYGGGIYVGDGDDVVELFNTEVNGNFVDTYGGGIYFQGDVLTLTDSDVSGNGTEPVEVEPGHTDWGGALYLDGGNVNIAGSTVTNNAADFSGGGVYHDANVLRVVGSTVSGNATLEEDGDSGGGLYLDGDTTITDSTVSDNTSATDGGGIYHDGGLLKLRRSTVSGNDANGGFGGGIYTYGPMTATNSTISGNFADDNGGGMYGSGDLLFTHVTVIGNSLGLEPESAAGVYSAGTLEVESSIVAANDGDNCESGDGGTITSAGYNLEDVGLLEDPGTCGFDELGDVLVAGDPLGDPMLDALAGNGGLTETHALAEGSPAIDAGKEDCGPPHTDQRGAPRPVDGDAVPGEVCDIGAFESGAEVPEPAPVPEEQVIKAVAPGGTVTTDTEGNGATPDDPVETTITVPSGGSVTISESSDLGDPPGGFDFFGQQLIISAPAQTVADPLVLVIRVDASELPPGTVTDDIQIFKDGDQVPNCTGAPQAIPDPCVQGRTVLGDGDAQITVLTSTASAWHMGVPTPEPPAPPAPGGGATHTLTVTKAGTGSGTVTSSPAGITCGLDCSEVYPDATVVTLTQAADTDSLFAGWGGACAGTGACVVTMDASKAVTATFDQPFTLTVTKAGTGSGTVTSSPAGIDCGLDCSEIYPETTVVTLTQAADTGSDFVGWGGACAGSGACVVTMDASKAVTATFDLVPEEEGPPTTPAGPPSAAGCVPSATVICGTDGNDNLVITPTANLTVILGAGNDTLCVQEGTGFTVTVHGGDGDDVVYVGNCGATARATGSAGSSEAVTTIAFDGGNGNDRGIGGGGNDSLRGGPGNDTLKGMAGNDTAQGDAGADTLSGGAGRDTLKAGADHDTLRGGPGKDKLVGGKGRDKCRGGPGKDTVKGCEVGK